MLFDLLQFLSIDVAETWHKITFRAGLAALVSFALAILLGPRMVAWLQARFREPNISDSANLRELHSHKNFTPTMGGLFIVAGILSVTLLLADWHNTLIWPALMVLVGLAAVGAIDDLIKLSGRGRGLRPRTKLLAQAAVSSVAAAWLYRQQHVATENPLLTLPFGASAWLSSGWCFIPWAMLVMVGSSNAVNLTDGLDGLAGGCLLSSTAAVAVLVYISGHAELATYLHLPHVRQAGELTIVAGGMLGGVLGFLWFNCHPAQVFMGDTGSLPLGGLLGFLALVARQELLLLLIGAVFVAEALSVIIQVGIYRRFQRRVFRCAPLHHHFQFLGWPEGRIVTRFWIVSALCAILGLATLKLHSADPNGADASRGLLERQPRVAAADQR